MNIYPEGSRTESGEIGPIEKGIALIIRKRRCAGGAGGHRWIVRRVAQGPEDFRGPDPCALRRADESQWFEGGANRRQTRSGTADAARATV